MDVQQINNKQNTYIKYICNQNLHLKIYMQMKFIYLSGFIIIYSLI